tara:strand:- start:1876 stop:3144 length:1269 start_codon:yes stop_codon:yes gene_type:complete
MSDLISKKIRGFRDILPDECEKFLFLEKCIHMIVPSFNINQIKIPVLESENLFKRSIGEQSDIVTKEMYAFTDRNDEIVCMTPEGTASCVRLALENNLIYDRGIKKNRFYYIAPMFRHERPQKGRYRQFQQFGVEFFGENSFLEDIDLLMLCQKLFEIIKLNDIQLSLNTIGSSNDRKNYSQDLRDYYIKNSKELTDQQKITASINPMRLLDSKDSKLQGINTSAPNISDYLNKDSLENFDKIQNALTNLNIPYVHDQRLVRGLDYYNDLVFEWKTDKLGTQDAICAGGRYDGLSKAIGGKNIPSVGFAMGMDRIIQLLDTESDQLIIGLSLILTNNDHQYKLISQIRDNIECSRLIVMPCEKSLTKQIKQAVKNKCYFLIIVGEDEISNNTLTIKYLNNDRNDESIHLDNLKNFIKGKEYK